MADYRDNLERKSLFESENYLSPELGYPERPLDTWFNPHILPIVKNNIVSQKNILDVGCAFGYISREFTKFIDKVHGVDLAQNRIDYAKQYQYDNSPDKYLKFNQIDLSTTPLTDITDEKFDNVYTSAVIQHIPLAGKPFAIRNIANVTRKGGVLLMFDHREDVEIKDDFVGSYNENYFIKNFPEWQFVSVEYVVLDTWFYKFIRN